MNTESTIINQSRNRWKKLLRGKTAFWFTLVVQPLLAVAFVIGLAWGFGYMQRNHNWFNDASSSSEDSDTAEGSLYACSMLCVFVEAPGRCPVCGMELQKVESTGDPKDIFGVTIGPTARRLANIETVTAVTVPVAKEITVLGRVTYDETTEASVSAYVDGRIEDLLVDFTGATIREGDELAVLYSPDLYSDQVGLLQAKKALAANTTNDRVKSANERLYQSARQRLLEQGLTNQQIDAIENSDTPNSRIKVYAPASGTVVAKLVEEGKYVKTGMPILKVADLSTVWLMLEMYPEDTADLELDQSVSVRIQSLPNKSFDGNISFIDPIVDEKTQTVNVRVAIPNESGKIKIGDFGQATIKLNRDSMEQPVVVPRESVLINGDNSIVYVETDPGRFEFRKVEVLEILGEQISLASGVEPGENVVASGTFMLDSTFNIQRKVSLIDPNRAISKNEAQIANTEAEAKEIEESFANLSQADRALAESQVICPVTEVKLGTHGMGAPIRVSLTDQDIMICCEGCRTSLLKDPQKYYQILEDFQSGNTSEKETQSSPSNVLPKMELPKMDLPKMELPKMELPK